MEDNKFDNYGFVGKKYDVDRERRRKPNKVVPIVQHKVEVMVDRTIAPTIPRIYHEGWIWRKTFWIICYLVCWALFLYTTYQLYAKYVAYGTNTNLSIVYQKEIVFPAVTVCDMNSLSRTKASGAKELNDLTQADSAMWQSVFSILTDSSDVDDFKIALKQPECDTKHFKCNDGSCIDSQYVCDFYADCQNGEDERNKTCFIPTTPGFSVTGLTFADLASEQAKSCPQTFSGNYPYEDATGDLNNLTHCCDWNSDRSLYTQVLPPWVVCDGYYHCADKSDEANCDSVRSLAFCPKKNKVNVTSTEVVYVNQMSELCMRLVPSDIDCNRWCKDRCLRKSQLCDGVQDCPNGLDESICSSSSDDDKDDNSNNVPSFGGGDNDDGDGVNDYEYFIPENEDETGYIDEGEEAEL